MLSVALGPTQPPVQFGVTQGLSGQGMKLSSHFHLVPRLKMSGTLPLLHPYAFMVLTGRTLPFLPVMGEGTSTMRKYHHRHIGRSPIDKQECVSNLQSISWAAS